MPSPVVPRPEPSAATTGPSEGLFAALVDAAPDAMLVADGDGRIVLVNAQAERLFRYSRAELLQLTIEALVPGRFRPAHGSHRARYLADPRPRPMGAGLDLRAVRKDGSEFDAEISLSPIRTAEGVFVAAAVRDVSERTRAQQRLRESEMNFRMLVENLPDLISVHRRDVVLYLNPAAVRFLGLASADQLVGKSLRHLVPPEEAAMHDARMDAVMRGGGPSVPREATYKRADGTLAIVEVVSLAMVYWGEPAVLTMGHDITERKQAEAVRARLAAIVESSDDAIYSKGVDGTIQSWNSGAARLFGHTAEEIVGQNASVLLPPGHVDEIPDVLGRLRVGRVEHFETVRRRKRGNIVEVSMTISAMRDGATGEIVGASVIARDISAGKEAERQVIASLREKELLLKEVHHRVKNNLQVIASLLNLQSRRIDDVAGLQAIQESKSRVQAIALFHEKLYRSKDFGTVDTMEYLHDLVDALFRSFAVDVGTQYVVEGDPLRLGVDLAVPCGLMVNELVSNCIKHAFPDGRQGTVFVAMRRVTDEEAKLVVADDGIGLPADVESRKKRSLGLELVATLCVQLGGRLHKTSGGGGTKFEILIPLPARGGA